MRSGGGWILALCLALAPAMEAHAWGSDGHRIVGAIAAQLLSAGARARMESLWPEDEAEPSLAEAAVWADAHARAQARYDFADRLHYVNVPPREERYRGRHCPDGCVVSAIKHYARVLHDRRLHDRRAGREARLEALRFLAHFVGDVHQPLHVAHPDRRGGTRTRVVFLGKARTLHWVWDTGLVEAAMEHRSATWGDMATVLRASLTPARRRRWSAIDPNAWATESLHLAQAHAFLAQGQDVGEDCVDAWQPLVEGQLLKAGVRLAALLDATLKEGALPATIAFR